MTPEQLSTNIARFFPTRRAFIEELNFHSGFEALNESTLSRQIKGKIGIGNGFAAAYTLFFERCEKRRRGKELG